MFYSSSCGSPRTVRVDTPHDGPQAVPLPPRSVLETSFTRRVSKLGRMLPIVESVNNKHSV